MTNHQEAFRGAVLQPRLDEMGDFSGFELNPDHVVVVDEGMVTLARTIDEVRGMSHERLAMVGLRFEHGELFCGTHALGASDLVLAPGNTDTHTHIYQPTNLGGRLMEWLPKMFNQGEIPAKQNPEIARQMARERLTNLAQNGTTRVIAWPTSSVESARIVLEEAGVLGLEVRVGFVAMDQNVPPELSENTEVTIAGLEELFNEFGNQVAVIDRFPIAVSSALRRELVKLARKHGALYEVHLDENQEEIAFVGSLYDGRSVVKVLAEDGVFAPGMKVGLAHSIHTTHEDQETLRWSIKSGCEVYVRACPNSNDQLRSHWLRAPDTDEGPGAEIDYVPFPLRTWQNLGAIVTMGTDLGAGSNVNLYKEMLDEQTRQQGGNHRGDALPAPSELLAMGTINGARSFGKSPAEQAIEEGRRAEFVVIQMDEPDASIPDPVESTADRLIRGGAQGSPNIVATYVAGRKII